DAAAPRGPAAADPGAGQGRSVPGNGEPRSLAAPARGAGARAAAPDHRRAARRVAGQGCAVPGIGDGRPLALSVQRAGAAAAARADGKQSSTVLPRPGATTALGPRPLVEPVRRAGAAAAAPSARTLSHDRADAADRAGLSARAPPAHFGVGDADRVSCVFNRGGDTYRK